MSKVQSWGLPDGRVVSVNPGYYAASCDECGWAGSSEDCGTDSGPWGDSDVYCPKCHAAGCDMGKLGEAAVLIIPTSAS